MQKAHSWGRHVCPGLIKMDMKRKFLFSHMKVHEKQE